MYTTPTADKRSSKHQKSLPDFSNKDFRIIRRDKKRNQMQQESTEVERDVNVRNVCL